MPDDTPAAQVKPADEPNKDVGQIEDWQTHLATGSVKGPDAPKLISEEAHRADEPEHLPADQLPRAALPAGGVPSDPLPNNEASSPCGPGKPIDGSPAVNTYTPRDKQSAEFEAGDQDWQALVAGPDPQIKLPSEGGDPPPRLTADPTPDETTDAAEAAADKEPRPRKGAKQAEAEAAPPETERKTLNETMPPVTEPASEE